LERSQLAAAATGFERRNQEIPRIRIGRLQQAFFLVANEPARAARGRLDFDDRDAIATERALPCVALLDRPVEQMAQRL
jgi:hypothetical protein